jgi:SAM-dependent methyltransferase
MREIHRIDDSSADITRRGSLSKNVYRSTVDLRCPKCHTAIGGLECEVCGFRIMVRQDIAHALPPHRAAHYAQFVADYERIRAAEGRGSQEDEYYLGLPYVDKTERNSHQWQIRARSYDCLMEHVLQPLGGRGNVLDLGAGNCWMSFRLALAGYDSVAVDLLTNDRDGLGAGVHYRKHLPKMFPRLQAEAANLPFQDAQFDAVIFNASFHYAEDYEAVLRETLRCLKPGGVVIISDTPWYAHVGSGERMVAERQELFLTKYGTASNTIISQEFLTDERLHELERQLSIRWETYQPRFGLKWAMRPWLAKIRGKREPSRFRIYVAKKYA